MSGLQPSVLRISTGSMYLPPSVAVVASARTSNPESRANCTADTVLRAAPLVGSCGNCGSRRRMRGTTNYRPAAIPLPVRDSTLEIVAIFLKRLVVISEKLLNAAVTISNIPPSSEILFV